MEMIPCPGCTTDLEPSATVCPICLRPRGKLEITRAYATMREMEKQRRQRPFVVAGYLLAAGAAVWLAYLFHQPIAAAYVFVRARAVRFMDEQLASAVPAPAPAPAPPPESAQTAAAPSPSSFPDAPSHAPAPDAPAPTAPPKTNQRPAHVEDLPFPAFDSGSQWVIYGRVYDLITLLPVPDAQLDFTMVSGNRFGGGQGGVVASDADGRFAAVLGRLTEGSSYEIRASRPGYASPALYESDIPYARLPLAQRHEIAHNAQDGDLTLPPLTDIVGEGSMRRDVFLAPSR